MSPNFILQAYKAWPYYAYKIICMKDICFKLNVSLISIV